MRNLKKVLSLTLALVMMLGMMTFAGAAETKIAFDDFKDKADITKVDAVRLMVDLGILVGDANGNFSPKGEIDRASMAKLVYTAKMGTADASALAGAGVFTDVAAKHWASGYVNYCASTKIIAGTTDVTFAPSAKVTTAAAAKMLLVALGYDAAHQGYVGNNWAVSSMRDASKLGMLEGIDQTANQNLTRENAAQMLYNALNTKTVENKYQYKFDGTPYVYDTVTHKTTLGYEAYKIIKLEATVESVSAGKATFDILTTSAAGTELGNVSALNDKLAADNSMVGNKVTFFVKGTLNADGEIASAAKLGDIVSTGLMATPFTLLGTSNNGTLVVASPFTSGTSKDLTTKDTKNKGFIAALDTPVTYYVNGASKNLDAANTAADKLGAIVELLDADDDGLADTVKVTEKTVATISGEVKTKTAGDGTVTVQVPGVTNGYESVKAYDGMKKGDVVLFVNVGDVYFIELAKTVEGVVTSKNSDGEIKVDGTYYTFSGLKGVKADGYTANDYKNTYTFYLDDAKSIVKAKQITDETTGQFTYVLARQWITGTSYGDSNYAEAKLLLTDGTVVIAKIAKIDGYTITAPAAADANTADSAGKNTSTMEIKYFWDNNGSTGGQEHYALANADENSFYTYTVNKDGKYELKTVVGTKDYTSAAITETAITGGKAVFNDTNVANSKTIFIAKTGTSTFKVYTGIAKLPDMTAVAATSDILFNDTVASFVFITVSGAIAGEAGELVYATGTKGDDVKFETIPATETMGQYDLIQAVVDGKLTTIKVDDAATVVASGMKAGTLYTVSTKDSDGIITEVAATVTKTGVKLAGDTLLLEDDGFYTVNADTQIFVLNEDGVTTIDYTAIENDVTDVAFVAKKDAKDVAEIVYICKVNSATKTFSNIIFTLNNADVTGSPAVTGDVTYTTAGADVGDTITIKNVTGVAAGASWSVNGTCVVAANNATPGDANKVVITITAEDGSTVTATIGFKAGS